jgi:hypothetical protein
MHLERIELILVGLLLKLVYLTKHIECIQNESKKNLKCNFKYSLIQSVNALGVLIKDFNKYTELNLDCLEYINASIILTIIVEPEKKLLLDQSLNFNQIRNTINFVNLIGIEGFDLNFNPFNTIKKTVNYGLTLQFSNARFKFRYNNKEVNMKNLRKYELKLFNGSFFILDFRDDTAYDVSISPYIFQNLSTDLLSFRGLSDSFIRKNQLTFDNYEIEKEQAEMFRSYGTIQKLSLSTYKYNLTFKIINKYLFENITTLFINGDLNDIETNLFRIFKQIREIFFQMNDLRDFVYRHLKHLELINQDVNFDYENRSMLENISKYKNKQILVMLYHKNNIRNLSLLSQYIFPNAEDLCLFKKFPFHRLLYPITYLENNGHVCTCVDVWLMRYNSYYWNNSLLRQKCKNTLMCNFSTILSNCVIHTELKSIRNKLLSYNLFNKLYDSKLMLDRQQTTAVVDFIIYNLLFPLIGLFGLILNTLNMLVLTNKKKALIKNRQYKFMLANSSIACLACFLNMFQFSVRCSLPNGRFCIETDSGSFVRYFHWIFLNYFNSILKMAGDFVHVFVTLDRYLLSKNKLNKNCANSKSMNIIATYKQINLKKLFTLIGLTCLALNCLKLLQYKVNSNYGVDSIVYPLIRENFYDNPILYWLNLLVYSFLENFSVLTLILIVDIKMIHFLKQSINAKVKLLQSSQKSYKIANLNFKCHKKYTRFVIINASSYLMFHSLEFIFTLMFLNISYNHKVYYSINFDYKHRPTTLDYMMYLTMAELTRLISYLSYFFLYIFFNKNFKNSLYSLMRLKQSQDQQTQPDGQATLSNVKTQL